ncbi:MAG: MFS transporter [Anaerolineales bacterium]|nr:MFS transporter [Anaerolineales bacterium]
MKKDFLLVSISLIIWGMGEGAFMYFQPLYLEVLGASPILIGSILGAVGLAMTLFHIPAGYLADRFGRRQLMWTAWGMGIITTGIMAGAKSLAVFSIGIILYSSTVFVISPLNSYVTSARHTLSVEQAMTITSAAFYLGGIVGPVTGGYLADHLGIRSIYFFAFGTFVISALIILFIKPQPTEKHLLNPAGDLLKNKKFLLYLLVIFLVYFALFVPQPLAPNFLKNQRGISLQTIGILGSITNLGNVLLNLVFGMMPARIGLILGQIFVFLFAALIWKFTQMPILVVAYFLLGGFRATRSLLVAQVEKLVQPANLGLAFGITEAVTGFSLVAAPPLVGLLYARDPGSVFSTSLLLIIPAILITYLWRKMSWKS